MRRRGLLSGLILASGLLVALLNACVQGAVGQSGRVGATASPAASSASPSAPPRSSGPGSDPLAPPSTPTPGPAVASDLVLTGALSGRVQNVQPLGACGRGPAGFAVALRFALGGAAYVLSVDILDYQGAGRYGIPPERVAVRPDARSGTPAFLPATSGMVEVAAGESSGKLDARLGSDGLSHVQGSWACR